MVLHIAKFPDEILRKAKAAAALQGVTLKDWILSILIENLK